jgi:hypothetical protein
MTPERSSEARTTMDLLITLFREAIDTNETLWNENERLQAGIDRQMGLVAQRDAEIGKRDAILKKRHAVSPELIARVRHSLTFARRMRFIALSLEVELVEELLASLGYGDDEREI